MQEVWNDGQCRAWCHDRRLKSTMSSSVSFEGAPVSGAVLLASVTSSLIAQGSHQSWSHGRSTSPSLRGSLAFKFAGELALGSLLLYQARVFERHKGTRRWVIICSLANFFNSLKQVNLSSCPCGSCWAFQLFFYRDTAKQSTCCQHSKVDQLFKAVSAAFQTEVRAAQNPSTRCRHGAVILAVFALDQLVHFALRSVTTLKFQPGPYSLIAFNFAAFYSDIPATSQSRILGLQLSNKVSAC